MHGEYKTPGGKLVVVDFEVVGNQLTSVQVTGDFFLYPEDALESIRKALEGVPIDRGRDEITSAVREAIDGDVQMVGFSPEAIAIAVERGLGRNG